MKKYTTTANIVLFALIVMIALNLVSLYMLHSTTEGLKEKRPDIDHDQLSPQAFIIKKLDFSRDQTAAYETLVRQHRKITKENKDDIKDLKKKLYGLLYLKPDNPEVVKLLDEISAKERSLAEETFDHFRQVRALCSDDQKKEFERVINRVMDTKAHGKKHGAWEKNEQPPP
jgi:periplasmic protein CpxP/Spy